MVMLSGEAEKEGKHHMAIKLAKIKRKLPICEHLKDNWNVYVHFSNCHVNNCSAWLSSGHQIRFIQVKYNIRYRSIVVRDLLAM